MPKAVNSSVYEPEKAELGAGDDRIAVRDGLLAIGVPNRILKLRPADLGLDWLKHDAEMDQLHTIAGDLVSYNFFPEFARDPKICRVALDTALLAIKTLHLRGYRCAVMSLLEIYEIVADRQNQDQLEVIYNADYLAIPDFHMTGTGKQLPDDGMALLRSVLYYRAMHGMGHILVSDAELRQAKAWPQFLLSILHNTVRDYSISGGSK